MPSKKVSKGKKRSLSPGMALIARPKPKRTKDRISLRDMDISGGTKNEDAIAVRAPRSRVDMIFKSMPVEIHQKIADFLPKDTDVTRYTRLCRRTYDSISSSVWRLRFVRTFDMVDGATPAELSKKYRFRRSSTKDWVLFDTKPIRKQLEAMGEWEKNQKNQQWSLVVLKDLILQSDARRGYNDEGDEVIFGLNQDYIRNFIHWPPRQANDSDGHTDLMTAVQNIGEELDIRKAGTRKANPARSDNMLSLAMVIQLCLTYLYLHPSTCKGPVAHFDDSQRQAYLCHKVEPVFRDDKKQEPNVSWLLHVVNFFKLQLKIIAEGHFFHAYNVLESHQLPQPWLGKIKEGTQQLGSHWKGAYTYMEREDLAKIRAKVTNEKNPLMDEVNDGHHCLQDLTIIFDDEKFSAKHWPHPWEKILHGNPFQDPIDRAHGDGTTTTRPRRRSKRGKLSTPEIKHFYGSAIDEKTSHFFGRVHAIPPQQGVYGFQRVTMMKFFPDENGNYDHTQVWAYEGCMLPGGRIIVGRWWAPRDELLNANVLSFCGPFIFWNVDYSAAPVPIIGEEALEFLETINDTVIMGN